MRQNDQWYEPISAQFQTVEDAMPLSRFAAIEAVLNLLYLNAPNADPMKAYLVFTQYQLIGITECSSMEHTLHNARFRLGYYRSQKYWQDDLSAYRDQRYAAFRAFSIEETDGELHFAKSSDTYPYPFELRKGEWEQFYITATRCSQAERLGPLKHQALLPGMLHIPLVLIGFCGELHVDRVPEVGFILQDVGDGAVGPVIGLGQILSLIHISFPAVWPRICRRMHGCHSPRPATSPCPA